MLSSKTSTRAFPRSLARYMAASAFRSSASGGQGGCVVLAVDLAHDRELVAAEPGHGIAGPERPVETPGDDREKLVAGLVAERIVHELEAIQVEEEDRDAVALALGPRQGQPDTIEEQHAVGEPGERVVQRP